MDKQFGNVREYKVKDYEPTRKQYNPKLSVPKVKEYVPRVPPKLQSEYNKPVKVPSKQAEIKYKEYIPAWSKGPSEKKKQKPKQKPKPKPPVIEKKGVLPGFSSIGSVKRTLYIFNDLEPDENL